MWDGGHYSLSQMLYVLGATAIKSGRVVVWKVIVTVEVANLK